MKRDLVIEFAKVTQHFGEPLDEVRLKKAAERITKDEVKRKTRHDPQVIQLQSSYKVDRKEFRERQGDLVWDVLTRDRSHLVEYFEAD